MVQRPQKIHPVIKDDQWADLPGRKYLFVPSPQLVGIEAFPG
jgi:hypothetical protein